jgi:Leucine-rich repeat (LRR) protein
MKTLIKNSIIACLMFTAAMAANAQVAVNETNFPDVNFRNYILEQFGSEVAVVEIAETKVIDVSNRRIANLKGIEYFTALETLWCYRNQLTSLDVSKLTKLQGLSFHTNQLTSLDVSALTNLQTLSCQNNQLSSLDVSELTNLQTLTCRSNKLTSLDVSELTNLRYLGCENNQLTSLDVAGLTNLQYLGCDYNQLTSLDVSELTNLQELSCENNQLTSLDVAGLTNLQSLRCDNNQLTLLDVSRLTNLQSLYCDNNQLTSLNVSALTNLQYLECYNNQLTSLDVSGLTNLQWLECYDQNPTLTLVGAEDYYSKEIELNEPTETEFATGIRYENNKLISTNSGIDSTPFEVEVTGWTYKMNGEITLLYDEINGIPAIENTNINIYPNPVKDELRIESGDLKIASVEIVDLAGKKIFTFNSQLSTHSINVSALPQGIYFVKLETDKGIVTKKIIKE